MCCGALLQITGAVDRNSLLFLYEVSRKGLSSSGSEVVQQFGDEELLTCSLHFSMVVFFFNFFF